MSSVAHPTASYDHALRVAPAWWRGALAILSLVAAYFLSSLLFSIVALVIDLATGQSTLDELAGGSLTFTPALMLANNLALAALWPIAMLLQWAFFGVRPRWLSSVVGRFRWRWLGRLALVIVPVWIVYVGISLLLGPLDPIDLSGSVIAMVLIVLFTTPLQSAGEEFGARGLIQRSVGSWFGSPIAAFVVGTIVSGGLFASAHAASDPWLIAYYFVFGASASFAARGTGGLEAPVLVHATNNVLLLVPTALMGQTDQVFERGDGAGSPFMLVPMALCVGAALFSTWWGRRAGIVTTAPYPPSRATRVSAGGPDGGFGASGGYAPPPAAGSGGYLAPPAAWTDGYAPTPPSGSGGYAPPPVGGYTPTLPSESGGYAPAPVGGYTPTPPSESGGYPPPVGGYGTPPAGGYGTPPVGGHGTAPIDGPGPGPEQDDDGQPTSAIDAR